MALTGQAKTDYQREYMRKRRSNTSATADKVLLQAWAEGKGNAWRQCMGNLAEQYRVIRGGGLIKGLTPQAGRGLG